MTNHLLPLAELAPREDDAHHVELEMLQAADAHAASVVINGALLADDSEQARLHEACDTFAVERCDCAACEHNSLVVTAQRERAAYYLGLAVGLRLARAVDGEPATVAPPEVAAAEATAPRQDDPPPDETDDTVAHEPDPQPTVTPINESYFPEVDRAAQYYLRRFGVVAAFPNFSGEEGTRFHEAIPRVRGSHAEYEKWSNAMDALKKKYHLSFEEVDTIESGVNGNVCCATEEGFLFGLLVGRQIRASDEVPGDELDELQAVQAVTRGAERPADTAERRPRPAAQEDTSEA